MSDVAPSPSTPSAPVPAVLAALQQEHAALAEASGAAPADAEVVLRFIDKVQAAGAALDSSRDRMTAGRILRYWCADALRRGIIGPSQALPALAPYAGPPADAAPPEAAAPVATPLSNPDEIDRVARSRKLIRLAALAREWRISGEEKGYLLNGDALLEARLFVKDDDDVAALVAASQHAARRNRYGLVGGLSLVTAVLAVLLVIAIQQAKMANYQASLAIAESRRAEDARLAAVRDKEAADQARLAEKSAKEDALAALDKVQDVKTRESRLYETVSRQSQQYIDLEAQLQAVRRQLGHDKGDDEPALPAVAVSPEIMKGYQSNFLGIEVPLPRIAPSLGGSLFNAGEPLASLNYGVVLDKARRMALLAASNYDQRSAVIIAPQLVAPYPDAAIPADVQPDPAWFRQKNIRAARLVPAAEIAWGFGSQDAALVGRIAWSAVSRYPNIVPQVDTFRQGLWNRLEQYASDQFNPGVPQRTVFAGPVLTEGDPVVDGVKLPRSYWKILVSTTLNAKHDLLVEAYLMPQLVEGDVKVPLDTPLDLQHYRVSVRDIERLTGLDFGQRLREAGQLLSSNIATLQQRPLSAGQALAARVPQLDAPDLATRQATTQSLIAALREGGFVSEADQRPVLQAMRTFARQDSFAKLPVTAQYNLVLALSTVPKYVWDQPDLADLKAGTRRAIADIEAGVAGGALPPTSQIAAQLQVLKQHLDWGLPQGKTISFQFYGMTRKAADDITANLRALGWTIPGAERSTSAAGVNEVRFGPADEAAGRLLVEDLKALGRNAVQAVPSPIVADGKPEIWLSD